MHKLPTQYGEVFMSLDVHIKCENKLYCFPINESLHVLIFSNATGWSNFKKLRKIKYYYRADCLFKRDEDIKFIKELIEICDSNSLELSMATEMTELIDDGKIDYVRVSSD